MAEQEPIAANVARRIRELRGSRRWNAERVAEEMTAAGMDWSRGLVTKLETGRRERVSVDEAVALARIFGVSLMELIRSPEAEDPSDAGAETARLVRAIAAKFGIETADPEETEG